jgi:integrase
VDPRAGRITVSSYADEWMAAQIHRPSTADLYLRHLKNNIKPVLGKRHLASIRTSEVQGWVRGLSEKGLAPSSVHTIHGIFASIMRGAVRDDRLHKSPCEGVRLPTIPKTEIIILEPAEITLFVTKFTPRLRALIVVAASTGLRQGEAFGLTDDSVRWLERTLVVDKQLSWLPASGRSPCLDRLRRRPASGQSRWQPTRSRLCRSTSASFRQGARCCLRQGRAICCGAARSISPCSSLPWSGLGYRTRSRC